MAKSLHPSLYGRVMNANLASIMPQIIGVWYERVGREVWFVCYTGIKPLLDELPAGVDLIYRSITGRHILGKVANI